MFPGLLLSARISTAAAATHSDRREISLKRAEMFRSRSDIFRLRTDKFRLRNDFVSPGGSQAVEIVGARSVRFRSFVRFQGVTPPFFRVFFLAVRFPSRPLGLSSI